MLLVIAGWLIARLTAPPPVPPQYHQLTFARETINSARFASDQRTVIYGSARSGINSDLFSIAPESLAPSDLGLKNADVLAISPSGEMLVKLQERQLAAYATVGVLARGPLTGSAPRPFLSDVEDADWGRDNEIAVTRLVNGRYRLEYPVGHVLYETDGYVSDVRVSPKGELVAFADHPLFGDDGGHHRSHRFGRSQTHTLSAASLHSRTGVGGVRKRSLVQRRRRRGCGAIKGGKPFRSRASTGARHRDA